MSEFFTELSYYIEQINDAQHDLFSRKFQLYTYNAQLNFKGRLFTPYRTSSLLDAATDIIWHALRDPLIVFACNSYLTARIFSNLAQTIYHYMREPDKSVLFDIGLHTLAFIYSAICTILSPILELAAGLTRTSATISAISTPYCSI